MHLTSPYHWIKCTASLWRTGWNFRTLRALMSSPTFKAADQACIAPHSQWKFGYFLINSTLHQSTQLRSNDTVLKRKSRLHLASKIQFWTKAHSVHRVITTYISYALHNCSVVHLIGQGDRIVTSPPPSLVKKQATCWLGFETKSKCMEGRAEHQLQTWP